MINIYTIVEYGDDYHGTRIVSSHMKEEEALKEKGRLKTANNACEECGHTYWYGITENKLTGSME